MACLALALQPANGPDILLQTRDWFPPARALAALSAFRHMRQAFSSSTASDQNELDSSALGDDPLAASSGQVVVGVESKYRVVYRLVNGIYVLGVTTIDGTSPSDLRRPNNVFECIDTVNQAVSVVVAACRGVDVTPDKLHRKYPEVYMALDIVLRGGAGPARLAAILSSIHGDSIAKMVSTTAGAEASARGADPWNTAPSADRVANIHYLSTSFFELPPETLSAGDEHTAILAPLPSEEQVIRDQQLEEVKVKDEEKDPFAASEKINNPEGALVGAFNKSKDTRLAVSDPAAQLAGLEVTNLPPPEATKPTHIEVKGFEGEYGGIEFGNEEVSLSEAFEGFDQAFGGGLDASEFIEGTGKKGSKEQGLSGLELLAAGPSPAPDTKAQAKEAPLESLVVNKTQEMTGPEMYIAEEISAEFHESLLARVGMKGTIYLRTIPPKQAQGKETEFSFRLEGTVGIKRAVMQSTCISSLENGMFYVKSQAKDEPIPIIKYSLQPKYTPLPLRMRLVKRHSGTLLSVMIQYASNPALPAALTNVIFILKLPVEPTLLTVSPKAVLNRAGKEVRWHVPDVPLKGSAGLLKVRMPVEQEARGAKDLEVFGMVKFSSQGPMTLSGISLRPVAEGIAIFNEVSHRYSSGSYVCI